MMRQFSTQRETGLRYHRMNVRPQSYASGFTASNIQRRGAYRPVPSIGLPARQAARPEPITTRLLTGRVGWRETGAGAAQTSQWGIMFPSRLLGFSSWHTKYKSLNRHRWHLNGWLSRRVNHLHRYWQKLSVGIWLNG